MQTKNSFSVLDMAKSYAEDNDIDAAEIFRKNPVSGNIKAETENNTSTPSEPVQPKKTVWTPNPELLDGMDELKSSPLTYSKDEFVFDDDKPLKNIADDNAIQSTRESMDMMSRKLANIEDAKKRFGIRNLQIPEGPFQIRIHDAAGDTNYKRAQEGLDEIFKEIVDKFPEFVRDWEIVQDGNKSPDSIVELPETTDVIPEGNNADTVESTEVSDTRIIIDKTKLPEISWSTEELEKIKKSRSIELNIVEDVELKYSNIEDVDDNMVSMVLSKYDRKVNDVVAPLPASKYRATFTGLTYGELMDLSYSGELNNIDGERKKWSIAFNHIKNPSIGNWSEYKYYIDPENNKKVICSISDPDPEDKNIKVVTVTKFDDFLMKTSYLDLEFILWKILCATAMDKEIISIQCKAPGKNGKPCNKEYDWIYSPNELLVVDDVDPAVLEDMKKTSTASSVEDIKSNYMSSMLNLQNTVELPSSKFGVVFGHISAYDYLNHAYAEIDAIRNRTDVMPSEAQTCTTITTIKAFLLPKEDGGYIRIKGVKNIIRVIKDLDEIDFKTIFELMKIMISPYQFRYSFRDICCPQCKNKSNINIEDLSNLLFTLTQSLLSVDVKLKKA